MWQYSPHPLKEREFGWRSEVFLAVVLTQYEDKIFDWDKKKKRVDKLVNQDKKEEGFEY